MNKIASLFSILFLFLMSLVLPGIAYSVSAQDGFDPNANAGVISIAVQADGKILIGGDFTTIGGVTRNRIARVTNTDAALQELNVSLNGSTVTWMRGQASPEVWRVTFEHSPDGATWTILGNGMRDIGGWEITGLLLPLGRLPVNQNYYLRARGYATGGLYNGSGSLVESVKIFYLKPASIVDFDGDGKTDVLWRNTATGANAVWYMDGVTLMGIADLPALPNTDFAIVGP
jgi:hypothetical protein